MPSRTVGLMLGVLLMASLVGLARQATQNVSPTQKPTWSQAAADLPTCNALVAKYYLDHAPLGVVKPIICTGSASPFTATMQVMASELVTDNNAHTLDVTVATKFADGTLSPESPAATCPFRLSVPPATPTNLRFVELLRKALGLPAWPLLNG